MKHMCFRENKMHQLKIMHQYFSIYFSISVLFDPPRACGKGFISPENGENTSLKKKLVLPLLIIKKATQQEIIVQISVDSPDLSPSMHNMLTYSVRQLKCCMKNDFRHLNYWNSNFTTLRKVILESSVFMLARQRK